MTNVREPSDPTTRGPMPTIIRLGAALAVLIGGLVHVQLYFSGYRNIPDVGASFVLQGIASVVIAGALVVRRDAVVRLAAAALAASTLGALALSRTDRGVFGFQERGLEPAPQTVIALVAEIVVLVAVAITFLPSVGGGESLPPRIAVPVLLAMTIVSVGASATWAASDGPGATESATPTTEPTPTTLPSSDTTVGPASTAPDTAVDDPETASTTTLQSSATTDGPASDGPASTTPDTAIDDPETASTTTPQSSATTDGPASRTPDTATSDDAATVVSIVDFMFDEQDLEIPVNTTVRWVNDDSFAHSVVADDGSFVSERLEPGDVFEFTFETAGQFDYICGIHPSMTATITVVG